MKAVSQQTKSCACPPNQRTQTLTNSRVSQEHAALILHIVAAIFFHLLHVAFADIHLLVATTPGTARDTKSMRRLTFTNALQIQTSSCHCWQLFNILVCAKKKEEKKRGGNAHGKNLNLPRKPNQRPPLFFSPVPDCLQSSTVLHRSKHAVILQERCHRTTKKWAYSVLKREMSLYNREASVPPYL